MEDDDTALASRPAIFRKLDKYSGQSARTLWVWPCRYGTAHAHIYNTVTGGWQRVGCILAIAVSYNNNMMKI